MAKFGCNCGHVIVLQTDMDPEEHTLLHDIVIEDKTEELEAKNVMMDYEAFGNFIAANRTSVLICPKCERIYLKHNGENSFTAYVQEYNSPAD